MEKEDRSTLKIQQYSNTSEKRDGLSGNSNVLKK